VKFTQSGEVLLIISRVDNGRFRFEVKDTGLVLRGRSRRRYLMPSHKPMEAQQEIMEGQD